MKIIQIQQTHKKKREWRRRIQCWVTKTIVLLYTDYYNILSPEAWGYTAWFIYIKRETLFAFEYLDIDYEGLCMH